MRSLALTIVTLAVLSASTLCAEEDQVTQVSLSDFNEQAVLGNADSGGIKGLDVGKGGGKSCGKGCGCGGGLLGACRGGEPWTLMGHLGRECATWQVSGHLNGGITTNFTNNLTSRNDPVPFSNPGGEFQWNQSWLTLERVADNGGCGYDWGYRLDFMYGTDGPDTQSFGDGSWDFGWNSGGEYGSAIPQLYFDFLYNDVKLRVGHFYTILGYEVVPATGNFFYSHAYAMTYGEPFTHTGVLAEVPYGDDTTLFGGYSMGWDSGWENRGDAHTMIGGLKREVNEFVTFTYAFTLGRYGNGIGPSGNLGDIYSHTMVLDMQLTDRSNFVLVHDLAINYALGGPVGNAEWYGLTGYYFYELSECWSAGIRAEVFDDADGLRIATVNDGLNDLLYWGVTMGLNYRPTPNLTIRPEIRADWATSHSDQDFNDVFVNNTRDNLQLFGCDFIVTF